MSEARKIFCAVSATLFGLLVLVTVIQFGGHWARVAALLAAFLAVISQFAAQDDQARSFHVWVSWLGFAAAMWAIIIFACGY